MKTFLRITLAITLLACVAIGFMAWRKEKSRKFHRDSHQAATGSKDAVNEELIRNAERLADRLRAVQKTAATNNETKSNNK